MIVPRHVLALSRDRGSMQAILPVIKALSSDAVIKISVVSMEVSRTLCEHFGINAEYLDPQEYQSAPAVTIAALLERLRPDIILSGSSPARGPQPETPEQYGIMEGRRRGIPSVAVLDFWGMYHERFVACGDRVSLELLPDVVCVLDERCREDLLDLGVPTARMRITHNPWLDRIAKESVSLSRPSALTQGVEGLRIVFVSQPLAEMGTGRCWSYDQERVLRFLLDALPKRHGKRHRVLVWPHPGEDPSRWKNACHYSCSDVEVLVTEERGVSVLAHVDLLASSHSTVIYEALYHGTPVISLRPDGSWLSPMHTDRLGLSLLFCQLDLLSEYLRKMEPTAERRRLLDAKQKLLAKHLFFSDGEATRRVTETLRQQLGLSLQYGDEVRA
jgi:hypothetical protein